MGGIEKAGFQVFKKADSSCFKVHVQPRAAKNEMAGLHGDAIKVRLTSPAVENRANRHLVDFFSRLLKIPKQNFSIISGQKARQKTIAVKGIPAEVLQERLTQYLV
ncbi:MAG TPA: DUF167 domain-containing protein [Acidobacteriota bacterium]|nr:DUF167 domain-containing protein [Acidobacteriota bacterium]